MADLLGSIMSSMEKAQPKQSPADEKQRDLIKQQREAAKKAEEDHKLKLKRFKEKTSGVLDEFLKDIKNPNFKFKPVPKVYRAIIHDAAEAKGIPAYSFGEEDIDRHVVVFKPEHAPCEEQLACLRRGEVWDPLKAEQERALREQIEKDREHEDWLRQMRERKRKSNETQGQAADKYKTKYEKFVGRDAGLEAARIAQPNKQFGFVPSENKRDARTIEQVLADSRAKRKRLEERTSASETFGHNNEKSNTV
ncbi:sperm-associated antigen 7-like isoform X2 [Varroa jacobsoni]|uniref:R3H domain-containing protein n=1 Tax=Varroa destructor TaxID=109461 RepID=A0A7M7KF68_VARDE|nr:sperm-associated antigen 7-like isoform X2 [Varroa destructor]XP_022698112.1 sperm-associated antigen 7-like isoform X2 [Varroa jacobsoni]